MSRSTTTLLIFAAGLLGSSLAAQDTLAIAPAQAAPALMQAAGERGNRLALGRVMSSLDLQLPQALAETKKFTLVERQNLQPIIEEQAIGESGNVEPDTAAAPFRLTGADYLLVVGIDDFQDFSDRATFEEISREIERRQVGIGAVARLYDTTTGSLQLSVSAEVEEADAQQYFTEGSRRGDTTEVLYRAVAVALSDAIAEGLVDALYPAKILAKTGQQITFNRGQGAGVEPGQTWLVFALGEELIDPDTGENLGMEEILLGQAEIIRVSARTSQALLREDNGVEKGHIIRPQ